MVRLDTRRVFELRDLSTQTLRLPCLQYRHFENPSKIRDHTKQSFSQENERLRKRKALHQEALITLVSCNRLPKKQRISGNEKNSKITNWIISRMNSVKRVFTKKRTKL